ncbi:hypothetical protein ABZP36_009805 [Zizania latifolia]
MAELAFGAVRSVLHLLHEEAKQLSRLGDDVQFIQEEMASMESFLQHLADMTPPNGAEHDAPVRTWMKQVRDLAFDCSNGIDQYVRSGRGSPRPLGLGLLRSMLSKWWCVLLDKPDVVEQMGKLKVRAAQVGERRQRYGVELPAKDAADKAMDGSSSSSSGGGGSSSTEAASDGGAGGGDDPSVKLVSDDFIRANLGFSDPNILEDNTKKLVDWLIAEPKASCLPRLPPLDKVIAISSPDQNGYELLWKAFRHRKIRGPPLLYKQVIRLEMPSDLKQTNSREREPLQAMLCFILKCIMKSMDNLVDKWDADKIAKEISQREGLKDSKTLFVIESLGAMGEYWDLMQQALEKFGCAAGSAVIVITDDINVSEKLTYSLVEYFTEKAKLVASGEGDNLRTNIRSVLQKIEERCEPRGFCMKMFVHYLYGNPVVRSKKQIAEEERLVRTLADPGDLLLGSSDADEMKEANGRKLIRFCYDDLPRAYRSCLLYLAIFPPGKKTKIWRSRLVMRWVVEGLIFGRDMQRALWEAERCFDTLINRGFICPAAEEDVGDARKVKSCIVVQHPLVQQLIQDGAREEKFLDPRLSRHLAKHFSVHGDLQLSRSDNIQDFMRSLGKEKKTKTIFFGSCTGNNSVASDQAELSLIKVLDLESFQDDLDPTVRRNELKNQSLYLTNVCNNLLLLKYLSIRNTNIDMLPKAINNLHHLEILDIRQTKVPSDATKDIKLPRLKCLLAGHAHTQDDDTAAFFSVQIPSNISGMPSMEVLSHVKASPKDAAKVVEDVGKLWKLRKLGVVIDGDLYKWLKAINDLNDCLLSLSVLINCENADYDHLKNDTFHLELLRRLSLRGSTSGRLLPLFLQGDSGKLIATLSLRDTLLDSSALTKHLKSLSSLQCLKLKCRSYRGSKLTVTKNMLPRLKFLIVQCREITSIVFEKEREAPPKLEKIVWYFTKIKALSGLENILSKTSHTKEIVLKGDKSIIPDKSV